jgi:hypothetical protein
VSSALPTTSAFPDRFLPARVGEPSLYRKTHHYQSELLGSLHLGLGLERAYSSQESMKLLSCNIDGGPFAVASPRGGKQLTRSDNERSYALFERSYSVEQNRVFAGGLDSQLVHHPSKRLNN